MIAVIFEVEPKPDAKTAYLNMATKLRPELEKIDGFISVERFESITTPGRMLSLSFWRDEDSVARWRQLITHRTAQDLGRNNLFADYRLRVASVIRNYGLHDRAQAPEDSVKIHG